MKEPVRGIGERQPTVLVAGATGQLGRALVRTLAEQRFRVKALTRARSQERLAPVLAAIEDVIVAEVTQPDTLQGICRDVDVVVSAIGITRQRDKVTYEDVDYGGNRNLLRASERSHVQKFIYVSVIGADRPSGIPVLTAKRHFEHALMRSSLDWAILRPSSFFTDIKDMLTMARSGRVHLIGPGTNRTTPVAVEDVAEATAESIWTASRRILRLGGPEDYTWNDIAELCFDVVNQPARVIHWPAWSVQATLSATRYLAPSLYGSLAFRNHMLAKSTRAPRVGRRTLRSFLEQAHSTEAVPLASTSAWNG